MRVVLLLFFLWSIITSYAQCPYDNSYFSTVSLGACPDVYVVPCIQSGQFIELNVVDGNNYTFKTCANTFFDTEITLYDASGTVVYGHNDDACGYQSILSWTATFTGVVHVLVDEYSCQNSGQCAEMEIKCSEPVTVESSNLPIVIIETEDGLEIPDMPKINATMGIIYNGEGEINYITDPFNEYSGNIGIETRGSSSQMFPKKSFGIETRDPQGNKFDVTMFNMAYDNDWVLYAPFTDKSLMRDVLAYHMGWEQSNYSPRTQFCEVIINGEYQGIYVLTEKIKNKTGKVGMDELTPEDLSGNEITGGYIVKVDKLTDGGVVAWTSPFPPYPGASSVIDYQMHEPELDTIQDVQLAYIQDYITDFESAMYAPTFSNPTIGYRPFIDVLSFIDFMIVNEVGKNIDGYRISSYLHKHRISEGGKLVAGPLWDFNLAFGNANYCNGGETSGWEYDFNFVCGGGSDNPFWWKKLTQDSYYSDWLSCRWLELRNGSFNTDSLMQYIDSIALYLSEAQDRNFQRWPILGAYVWPNNYVGTTYQDEVDYLKNWLSERLNWLDSNIGTCDNLNLSENKQKAVEIYPNPADQVIKLHNESLSSARIIIRDISGKTLYDEEIDLTTVNGIDVSDFAEGLYYLSIQTSDYFSSQQFSIIR